MRAGRFTTSVALCGGLLGLAASCGTSGHRQAVPTTSPSTTTSSTATPSTSIVSGSGTGWVRSDLKPVSQPVAVGGVFVVYVSASGGLELVGLDARSGRTLWQDPASPGTITPGVAPELTIADNAVWYLKPSGSDGAAQLVAASSQTGAQVSASPPALFSNWPELCPGDVQVICLTGTTSGQETSLFRFDDRGGTPLASPVISTSSSGRELSPGLFDPGVRNPEQLVAASGAAVGWSKRLSSIYSSAGLSTDGGWNIDRINRLGMFVGSVAGGPVSQTATKVVFDLSRTMTAGFRVGDGSVVWQDPHTSYMCSILPCPGATGTGSSGAGGGDSTGPNVGIRIRATGTLSGNPGGGLPTVSPGATAILEGFTPATGRTLWSFDIGSDLSLIAQTRLPPRLASTTLILTGRSGTPVVLNLANGTQTAPPHGGTAWCQSVTTYHENVPYQAGNGQSISQYVGDYALFPCDGQEHPVATPTSVPSFVGPQVGGLVAWSEASQVAAAPVNANQ